MHKGHLRREELRKEKELKDEEKLEHARLCTDSSVAGFVFKSFRCICCKSGELQDNRGKAEAIAGRKGSSSLF